MYVSSAVGVTQSSKFDVSNGVVHLFGPFRMDVAERRLSNEGGEVALARKSFDLLLALVESAGHLQTRESLLDTLWPNSIVEEHTLTWHLSALRRALGDTGDAPRYIETVRGYGYRFIAAVHDGDDVIGAPWEPAAEVPATTLPSVGADEAAAAPSAASAIPIEGPPERSVVVSAPVAPAPADTRKSVRRVWAAVLLVVLAGILGVATWQHAAAPPAAADAPSPRSIAVLPFENLSSDPANAYFASGMQGTILSQLASIRDLRVVSRMSSEGYSSHPTDLAEVLRQLNVASVLEGNVQKAGNEVLINIQLIDGRSGAHLWGHSYRRSISHVFDVQIDVAEQVALALQAELLPVEEDRFNRLPTRDAQAYDQFLKGEYSALQVEAGTANDRLAATAQARAYYQEAVTLDPRFALAFARLSFLESHTFWLSLERTPARAAASQRAAERALELDPELAQAHLAMGYVHYYTRRDYDAALVEFERARRDLPNNAEVNVAIANILRRRGQWQVALSGYERAETLDPRNPQWPTLIGDTLVILRRNAAADAAYDRALAVDPGNATASVDRIFSQLLNGDVRGASDALSRLPGDADPDGYATSARFVVAWLARDADAALAALAHAPDAIEAPWTPSRVPTVLLRAQALELKGDDALAQQAYATARDELVQRQQTESDDPATVSLLGLAEAGLHHVDAAVKAGQRAVELLPLEKDAVLGSCYLATLADIRLRLGQSDEAVALLQRLLDMPAGRVISPSLIERDPRFDAVRSRLLARRHPGIDKGVAGIEGGVNPVDDVD